MNHVYDRIGEGYSKHRCADRRIVEQLTRLLQLSPSATIADVGAGTGNYSNALADQGFKVEAIEPSVLMRRLAVTHAAVSWSAGTAERLPLLDNSVDAVACIFAAHHFSSPPAAIAEMARVCGSGPIVWLTFDPRLVDPPWLADYFPTIWDGAFSAFPPLAELCRQLADGSDRQVDVSPLLVPHDLEDCFMAAGWRRPEMYLDPEVRACMSPFAMADAAVVESGLLRLSSDLQTGRWQSIYGDVLDRETVDWGYRLIAAR
jgi:ubiquinone/menaquinone biosynthesis C-methylase UbiE